MFTQELLQTALAPRAVVYEPRTGSTNDDALAWIHEGAPEGAVVIADEQTQGRGRMGRHWDAPSGEALLLSIIVYPQREYLTRVSMIGSLAVADMIESYGVSHVDIKWPNDVRIMGRKVSGVLPEAAWSGDKLLGVALGIGVNLCVEFADAPYAPQAINLNDVLDAPANRVDALRRLLARVDHWVGRIADESIFHVWRARLPLGTHVQVHTPTGMQTGIAEDVDVDGALLLRTASGSLERVLAGDVLMEAGG